MAVTARPRLLLLVHLPPPVHGVTRVNQIIADSTLFAERFDIRVVPLRFADSVAAVGQPSVAKAARAGAIALQLARELVRWRPDALYASVSPRGVAFYRDCAYIALARALRIPVILHVHGKSVPGAHDRGWRRRAYEVAFSDAFAIYMSERLVIDGPTRDICIVPNGIPDEPREHVARAATSPPRILFLSNMVRAKGPLVLLEAVDVLRRRGCGVSVTFAGAPGNDGCLADLEDEIARRGFAGIARYVGPVYDADKAALLASHDIFVHPTYDDAFPLVLLEAMQFGLPVVASDEGGIADIVADAVTGLLVPPRDVEELATALQRLLGDAALRERMGRAGRARFVERFTADRFEHALADAIDRFLAQAGRPV